MYNAKPTQPKKYENLNFFLSQVPKKKRQRNPPTSEASIFFCLAKNCPPGTLDLIEVINVKLPGMICPKWMVKIMENPI